MRLSRALAGCLLICGLLLLSPSGLWAQEAPTTPSAKPSLMIDEDFVGVPVREAIEMIAETSGKTITVGPNVSGEVTVRIRSLHWLKALRVIARKVDAFVMDHGPDWAEVVRPPLVTFSTDPEGTDIKAVLDAIAVNYGFNLVMSTEVEGNVHLRLNRVPWRKAVEVAVKAAGDYAVVEEDFDIIRIVPVADLATQLKTRVFPLKFITAPSSVQAKMSSSYADIASAESDFTLQNALQKVVTPDIGFLEFDADNRAFIVKDTQPVLKEVASIIEMLDVPRPQVLVEVYVVSTSRNDFIDFGVDYGAAGPIITMTGGSMFHRLPFQIGDGGFEDQIGIPLQTSTVLGGASSFHLPQPTDFINNTGFTAGQLDFSTVQAVLKFIQTDSRSKVVQSPKITVLDNQRATIFSGEEIRYAQSQQVSAQDGSLNLIFNEADSSPVNVGFQMFITPHIIPGTDRVILDVIPQSDSLTGTTSALAGFDRYGTGVNAIDLPRISSQTVVTQIMVESGRTAMIGGLVNSSDTRTERKLPFFGDLPVLGFFFRNKSRTKAVSNLTIFIRPSIVNDDEASALALEADLQRREREALKEFRLRTEDR